MIDIILKWDTELFLFLNNLGSNTWDWLWSFITHKYYTIPLYIFMIYLLLKKENYKWKSFIISFLSVIMVITIIDMSIDDIIRPYFQRLRPYKELDWNIFRVKGSTGGTYGFFSAHAANSFGFATIMFLYLKNTYRYIWIIFIWAGLNAYSRIYLGVHYPTDIIVGILYGLFWGYTIFKLRKLIKF